MNIEHKHTPSRKQGNFKIFCDFLFHKNELYDNKTNTATCAQCGKMIELPREYYDRYPIMTIFIFALSFAVYGIGLRIFGMFLPWLKEKTPLVLIITYAFLIVWLLISFSLRRIYLAALLTKKSWRVVEIPDGQYPKVYTELEAKAQDAAKRLRFATIIGLIVAFCI